MIPKIIHYCWLGGTPLPELAVKCIESWKKYCPNYEIKEWNEGNFDFTTVCYMKEAFERKAWGFVPDVARLQIIYKYGGIYLDTDVELCKSLDDLLADDAFLGMESESTINLGLGFGAIAGHPIIKCFLDEYENMHFINNDGSVNRRPSPGIQTETIARYGFVPSNSIQNIMNTIIYPSEYFCPVSYETGVCRIGENTYSIHHYNGSWLTKRDKYWDEKKRKCNRIFGRRITENIWRFVRLGRRVYEKGIGKTIKYYIDKLG